MNTTQVLTRMSGCYRQSEDIKHNKQVRTEISAMTI
ncbi:hypothetical protein SVI_4234 [Shewanella violacea DSS12]|uniref:Uncharacterized protein n=1 Tax=Shewanella violacea (strain JCM 10179 / CIP 106290 / LMG 19151 / DSS12) TaxID=637905 RepID=D4ZF41_SHEVD|nr:hypothetical protein SVI_4234 [Shewanella violacea DSS12]